MGALGAAGVELLDRGQPPAAQSKMRHLRLSRGCLDGATVLSCESKSRIVQGVAPWSGDVGRHSDRPTAMDIDPGLPAITVFRKAVVHVMRPSDRERKS
jgi:hypothetical protein